MQVSIRNIHVQNTFYHRRNGCGLVLALLDQYPNIQEVEVGGVMNPQSVKIKSNNIWYNTSHPRDQWGLGKFIQLLNNQVNEVLVDIPLTLPVN